MFCQVVFDVPLDRTFDYLVPADLEGRVKAGLRVTAPFGRLLTTGLVVGTSDRSAFGGQPLMKEIACVLDERPVFGSDLFTLADFIKRTWGGPIGQILFALVPPQAYFKLAEPDPLPQQGFIPPVLTLNKEQTTVFEHLSAQLNAGFHRVLLSGADETGQTQIALRLAAQALQGCGQALITLPDVLAAQNLAQKLRPIFGADYVFGWHSKMPLSQKKKIFSRVSNGLPCLIVSARSGGLLPFKNLRLAAMLEEENDNYPIAGYKCLWRRLTRRPWRPCTPRRGAKAKKLFCRRRRAASKPKLPPKKASARPCCRIFCCSSCRKTCKTARRPW